jgi:hypothetical protein
MDESNVDPDGSLEMSSKRKPQFKERISNAYGHFAETTTFGGPVHTWVSPLLPWRLSWVFVLILLLAATIWNTREVVLDYFNWPVVTDVSVATEQRIPFPSVTVCNRNPVNCTKLAFAYIRHQDELNDLMYYSQCPLVLTSDPLRARIVCKINSFYIHTDM